MEFVRKSFAIFTIALLFAGSANAMNQPVLNNNQPQQNVQQNGQTAPGFFRSLWTRVCGWGSTVTDAGKSVYNKTTTALTTPIADATYNATLSL